MLKTKIVYWLPITSIFYTLKDWIERVPNNPIDNFPIIHGIYCGALHILIPCFVLILYIL